MTASADIESHGDFETIARSLVPSDLEIIKSLLEAEGLPAFIVDGGINQVYSLLSVATGGARLQVATVYARQARRIMADFEAGQLALEDDADVGPADGDAVPEKRKRRLTAGAALLLYLFG